jgi:hypothetical protein
MNGNTLRKRFALVAQRDGECCKRCGARSTERQLILDHIDNNPKNNRLDNLQILCRPCNYLKNPRRPVNLCVSGGVVETKSAEITINQTKEPQFRKYLLHELNERGSLPLKDFIYSSAEIIQISPETAKRYLNKICSSAGICQIKTIDNTDYIQYKDDLPLM